MQCRFILNSVLFSRGLLRLVFISSCLLWVDNAMAGNTFKFTGADGGIVFSDVSSGGSRQYKKLEDTSRPVAHVSCSGHIDKRLTDPGLQIQKNIHHFADRHAVNRNLVKAVARIESCFDTRAVSTAGAKGLMQLMPGTAAQYGVTDIFDVRQNIGAGVKYLSFLLKKFKYNEKLALAAYNAGPGAVEHYQGVPPYPETRSYVSKVLVKYREYADAK